MSNGPSRHCHAGGRHRASSKRWTLWLCGMLLAACEPRMIEIEGLDELTRELRGQRLQNSLRQPTNLNTPTIAGEQIQAAMLPLRDVLTQIGASQRDLSERHAALTLEMRRWTQLLVQSMQSGRSEEAKKLDQRLAELEQTIVEQDSRHREVEGMIGSALDKTADQLAAFLKHFAGNSSESSPPEKTLPDGGMPTANSGTPASKEDRSAEDAADSAAGGTVTRSNNRRPSNEEQSNNRTAPTNNPPPKQSSTRPAKNSAVPDGVITPRTEGSGASTKARDRSVENQQASMAWLWVLSVAALVSGSALLFSRRRTRPMAMPTEMQFAPSDADSIDQLGTFEAAVNPASIIPVTSETDEAEVEELWAAAALLGEAIDRLKQADDDDPPELGGAQALPDIPVGELESETTGEPPRSQRMEPRTDSEVPDSIRTNAIDTNKVKDSHLDTGLNFATDDDKTPGRSSNRAPATQRGEPPVDAPMPENRTADTCDIADTNLEQRPTDWKQAIDPLASPAEPELAGSTNGSQTSPTEPVDLAETDRPISPSNEKSAVAEAMLEPAKIAGIPSPLTCRIQLAAGKQAANRIQTMLRADPRVLTHPEPQIRAEMGELEISFALLPGLPAGERSILEQQVRDTVA